MGRMKNLLITLVVALLVMGCGWREGPWGDAAKAPKASTGLVAPEQLIVRDGVSYFEGKPFTGVATETYNDKRKWIETTYQDGKLDGPSSVWSQGGKKQLEENYQDGTWTGLRTKWYESGQKWWEHTYQDGRKNGLWTEWYENGRKAQELSHQDDKLTSAVSWKPGGETCPVTKIEGGDGVVVYYYEDGAEKSRTTYKNGEEDRSIAADAEKAPLVEE